ncbi:T6SS phospholipase effector Tle1-like catalytic domain-containing protein [Marinobacter sediminum]|uniref:phospholipase effector Tle1 domain-containing protein n=1 Tax=Marinobacter sediminum TaxID=256323 RepID=UPI00193AB8B0|nr:DUF2235 domain-containing protein [Marinobacter sediminum]
MHIKPRTRLKASDLPFVESPILAARLVKRALLGNLEFLPRFDPYDVPGFSAGARPEFISARLLSSLESGELVLIRNSLISGPPLDPPVVWKPDPSSTANTGKWSLSSSSPFLSLENEVDTLNRNGVTLGSLGLDTARGSAGQRSAADEERRPPPQNAWPGDHKLSLPLGAAAGLVPFVAEAKRKAGMSEDKALPLRVAVGVFTDGTLNNVGNIEAFKQRLERDCLMPLKESPEKLEECREKLRLLMGESYANEPTNVAKLWRLYREDEETLLNYKIMSLSVYVPGAGTKTGDADSFEGMATGLGKTGVVAQVERGFFDMAERVSQRSKGRVIEQLTLDFFGFSRGAAAARYAVNEIRKGAAGLLGKAWSANSLEWPGSVDVRFVGLFDTVAGIINWREMDLSAGNDRNAPVDIHLNSQFVGKAVHLTAKDEKRNNFALNSLKDADGKLASNFREIELPGAHSDIGGGYSDVQVEKILLHPKLTITGSAARWPTETREWDNLLAIKQRVESERWIGRHSSTLGNGEQFRLSIEQVRDDHPVPDGRVELRLQMLRLIKGEYSRVPLRLMHALALEEEVPFEAMPSDRDYFLPEDLMEIHENLRDQVCAGKDVPSLSVEQGRFLKQRYIHHSNHFNLMDFLLWDEVLRLEIPFRPLMPSRPVKALERHVHANSALE